MRKLINLRAIQKKKVKKEFFLWFSKRIDWRVQETDSCAICLARQCCICRRQQKIASLYEENFIHPFDWNTFSKQNEIRYHGGR